VGVSVGYSWIRRRDLVSNDGLTVVPHLRHAAWRVIPRRLRSVGSLVWSEESIVFWWLDGDRFQRSDHEETHGREPFSRFSLHLTFPLPRKSLSGEFVKSCHPKTCLSENLPPHHQWVSGIFSSLPRTCFPPYCGLTARFSSPVSYSLETGGSFL
jgi:hypothetical protein